MKNKMLKNDDYRQMRTKIFVKTLVMMIAAAAFIWFINIAILRGNFANWLVAFFQDAFQMDFDAALSLYLQKVRKYIVVLYIIAIVIVFFLIFRIYLNWFTKYFGEVNHGMDALIKEDMEEVSLSPELAVTEKKINLIKHTLEKRKMDAQLAEQRKNDLVVYLAHDLKTPLTSVIGYLTLLRDESQISEELREKYLAISLGKAERLEELINEFFEITRFNLSNITLEYSRINLTRMLEQLVYECKPVLASKNLKCSLHAAPDIMIKCDSNKLQRVFDNLLRNGINYSYEDTTIEVTARKDDTHVIMEFINQGDTIPEEKIDRIFEQFYRLDTSRSSETGGAGLGLAIAKEIVELHHGEIMAHSEDDLTCFKVLLPLF